MIVDPPGWQCAGIVFSPGHNQKGFMESKICSKPQGEFIEMHANNNQIVRQCFIS